MKIEYEAPRSHGVGQLLMVGADTGVETPWGPVPKAALIGLGTFILARKFTKRFDAKWWALIAGGLALKIYVSR